MYQMIIYLVLLLPAGSSNLPKARRAAVSLLFGLASDGVYICRFCYQPRGSPLHCLSTLTSICWRFISVALSLESPPPDVIWHPALRSPDFPHLLPFGNCSRNHLCYSVFFSLYFLLPYGIHQYGTGLLYQVLQNGSRTPCRLRPVMQSAQLQ